ncbi:MAG TPA: hypothetical protein DCL76_00365 [Chloroflexi bacterium]|nr:hypothetical protein [Chloroflexota bacterium]HCU99434.1 hypothetical protein [Chloroflexota bacterium]|tara:strand:- start:14 stop:391 length:378 start_codon:yes stop_codon:yes gene_type:complete
MKTLLIRWSVNVVSIWVVQHIVAEGFNNIGMTVNAFIINGLILTIVDSIVRPIVRLVTCPIIMATLGLGGFLVNVCMLLLSGWIGLQFGYGFQIVGLLNVIYASLILIVTRFGMNLILRFIIRSK